MHRPHLSEKFAPFSAQLQWIQCIESNETRLQRRAGLRMIVESRIYVLHRRFIEEENRSFTVNKYILSSHSIALVQREWTRTTNKVDGRKYTIVSKHVYAIIWFTDFPKICVKVCSLMLFFPWLWEFFFLCSVCELKPEMFQLIIGSMKFAPAERKYKHRRLSRYSRRIRL